MARCASAPAARAGLLAWATAYGTLATEAAGRETELAALRARYDRGVRRWDADDWVGARIAELPVFSPGDICPDNNLLGPDGMRVLDFEHAGFRSVFLDAAYVTMRSPPAGACSGCRRPSCPK